MKPRPYALVLGGPVKAAPSTYSASGAKRVRHRASDGQSAVISPKATKAVRVGVWDLGSRVARLDAVVQSLDQAQDVFSWRRVEASVPAGLTAGAARVRAALRLTDGTPAAANESPLPPHLIAIDLVDHAEFVRTKLSLDYLVCLAPQMIIGADDAGTFAGRRSHRAGNVLLLSLQGLRALCGKEMPFEAAAATLFLRHLLAAANPPVGDHLPSGCLFDATSEAEAAPKALSIDAACLDRMDPLFREPARRMVLALAQYGGNR